MGIIPSWYKSIKSMVPMKIEICVKPERLRMTVSDIGPSKKLNPYENRKKRKEYSERNAVEGKIG